MEKTRGMMAGKKRWIFCVIFCFSVLFSNFSSANFVCGEVTSDSDVLPTWMNLLVYYDSAPEDTINCMVTGEHKYCCDLEQIESVNWSSGLLVLAEVYDDSGFVTERVSTQTSDAAYDLFPTLSIAKAIDFVDEVDTIIIDTEDITQQEFNVVLHPAYNNLRVIIDHAGKEEVMEICTDCSEAHFTLDLLKGKNSVSFVAYGSRDMSVTQDFYVLDYLTIDRSFSCDNCNTQEEGIYVGGGEEVTVTLRVDSSHPLDGSLTEYIPSSWEVVDSNHVIDVSSSHNGMVYDVSSSSDVTYVVQAPATFLQKTYTFFSQFDSSSFEERSDVSVLQPFWFSLPVYFEDGFAESSYYEHSRKQIASFERPLIIQDVMLHDASELILAAVYLVEEKGGTKEGDVVEMFQGTFDIQRKGFFTQRTEYTLLSDLSNHDIEKVYLQFRIEKSNTLLLYQGDIEIDMNAYDADEYYIYYDAYLTSKDKFYTIVS